MMFVIRLYFWTFIGHLVTFWKMNPLAFFWGILCAFNDLPTLLRAAAPARCKAIRVAVDWLEENAEKEYPAYPRFIMNRLRLLASSADAAASDG